MAIPAIQRNLARKLKTLLPLVFALGIGAIFCALASAVSGNEPLAIISAIAEGAWGNQSAAANTLARLTPLLLTGLAVSFAYHAGLLNIGCEGQLILGALASAVFAVKAAALPAVLLIPSTVAVGAAAGALWALPAILLKQKRGVHEVIATLLMNYIAINIADYLVRGPLGDGSAMARTPMLPMDAVWPLLWRTGTQGLTAAPVVALLLCLAARTWLSRTVWGFELAAVGSNPTAAATAGVSVDAWRARAFVLSGALAGLAGALEVVAVHHRFYAAFSPGYGFDGITVSFLVDNSPGRLWLGALLLASLRSADKWLQLTLGISPNAILVLEAVLLLTVVCRGGRPMLPRRFLRSGDNGGTAVAEIARGAP